MTTRGPVSPREITCPACMAQPGQACNAPTNDGRRNVTWHHIIRDDYAREGRVDWTKETR